MGWGGGTAHFWDIFITSHLHFEYLGIYYTNTISNQTTGMYWPHTKALYRKYSHMCHQWHSRFCKNAVSKVRCTSTFDPTTYYLVDYNQQQCSISRISLVSFLVVVVVFFLFFFWGGGVFIYFIFFIDFQHLNKWSNILWDTIRW